MTHKVDQKESDNEYSYTFVDHTPAFAKWKVPVFFSYAFVLIAEFRQLKFAVLMDNR